MDVVEDNVFANLPKIKDNAVGDVGRFLNRILGLSVGRQQLVSYRLRVCMSGRDFVNNLCTLLNPECYPTPIVPPSRVIVHKGVLGQILDFICSNRWMERADSDMNIIILMSLC